MQLSIQYINILMLSESCYDESVNPQLEALNAFHDSDLSWNLSHPRDYTKLQKIGFIWLIDQRREKLGFLTL